MYDILRCVSIYADVVLFFCLFVFFSNTDMFPNLPTTPDLMDAEEPNISDLLAMYPDYGGHLESDVHHHNHHHNHDGNSVPRYINAVAASAPAPAPAAPAVPVSAPLVPPVNQHIGGAAIPPMNPVLPIQYARFFFLLLLFLSREPSYRYFLHPLLDNLLVLLLLLLHNTLLTISEQLHLLQLPYLVP